MITVKDVSHHYNGRRIDIIEIFKHLNFKINNGEFVSFVGPSGCGKTTLVSILAGYIKPTSGEIFINDTLITKPARDRVVINQENDLFTWMTVLQNMELIANGKTHDIAKYLTLVNLLQFKDRYPNELSGGMKKLLAFARALIADSKVIIMDEPFSSLDYQTRERLHEKFLQIAKKSHKTIILVTHDVEEAVFLSDRVIVFSKRPAVIREEIKITLPSFRRLSIKDSKEFNAFKHRIKSLLETS